MLVWLFETDILIWIIGQLNMDHLTSLCGSRSMLARSKIFQIMTMDHGYVPLSKSCHWEHDQGPNHDFVDYFPNSLQLWKAPFFIAQVYIAKIIVWIFNKVAVCLSDFLKTSFSESKVVIFRIERHHFCVWRHHFVGVKIF